MTAKAANGAFCVSAFEPTVEAAHSRLLAIKPNA